MDANQERKIDWNFPRILKGNGVIARLTFIAKVNPLICYTALCQAIAFIEETYNVRAYRQLHESLMQSLLIRNESGIVTVNPPIYKDDWVLNAYEKAIYEYDDLLTNKIFSCTAERNHHLGLYYLKCGEYEAAVLRFKSARNEYKRDSFRYVEASIELIKAHLYNGNLNEILQIVQHTERTMRTPKESGDRMLAVYTTLRMAEGLVYLHQCDYENAALQFLKVKQNALFDDILTAIDAVAFAGLCALATISREQMKEEIINPAASFHAVLEKQGHIHTIIYDFYNRNFSKCFQLLDGIRVYLQRDVYIAPHVSKLYEMIRHQALLQYIDEFAMLSMSQILPVFPHYTAATLETKIRKLIEEHKLDMSFNEKSKMLRLKDWKSQKPTKGFNFADIFNESADE